MARLDRLGAAKEVAQIGAAIGREFSHDLLAAVVRKPEAEFKSALDRLIAAGLLFRQGVPPQATYLFKHALVQDAAYGTLLRNRRQQLHARIAATLEGQFPEIVETQPELMARHCAEAGLVEKAVGYWTLTGEWAVKRDANAEATRHFRRALELLEKQPETAERGEAELKVLTKLGPALQSTRGFGAPEVETAYLRARELCEQLGEPVELFQALWGLWLNSVGRNDGTWLARLPTNFSPWPNDWTIGRSCSRLTTQCVQLRSGSAIHRRRERTASKEWRSMIGSSTSRWPFFLAIMIPGCAAACTQRWPCGFSGTRRKPWSAAAQA